MGPRGVFAVACQRLRVHIRHQYGTRTPRPTCAGGCGASAPRGRARHQKLVNYSQGNTGTHWQELQDTVRALPDTNRSSPRLARSGVYIRTVSGGTTNLHRTSERIRSHLRRTRLSLGCGAMPPHHLYWTFVSSQAVAERGHRWSQISKLLPGRCVGNAPSTPPSPTPSQDRQRRQKPLE